MVVGIFGKIVIGIQFKMLCKLVPLLLEVSWQFSIHIIEHLLQRRLFLDLSSPQHIQHLLFFYTTKRERERERERERGEIRITLCKDTHPLSDVLLLVIVLGLVPPLPLL